MAKSQKPEPEPATIPQQQGKQQPAGQMTGTAEPSSQQGQPLFRDWAAI